MAKKQRPFKTEAQEAEWPQFRRDRRYRRNTRLMAGLWPTPAHLRCVLRASHPRLQSGRDESSRSVRESGSTVLVPRKSPSGIRLFSETAKEAGVQPARLAVGFFESLTGGVTYARRLLARAVSCARSPDWRLAS